MTEPVWRVPERFRMPLDSGEIVEYDGSMVPDEDGRQTPAVVLRMPPDRAQTLADVVGEWSAVSRLFTDPFRPSLDEQELARTLRIAATATSPTAPTGRVVAVVGGSGDAAPVDGVPRSGQRALALTELSRCEARLTSLQRIAVVDAAAWVLTDANGGDDLAYALLEAACSSTDAVGTTYVALTKPLTHRAGSARGNGVGGA